MGPKFEYGGKIKSQINFIQACDNDGHGEESDGADNDSKDYGDTENDTNDDSDGQFDSDSYGASHGYGDSDGDVILRVM